MSHVKVGDEIYNQGKDPSYTRWYIYDLATGVIRKTGQSTNRQTVQHLDDGQAMVTGVRCDPKTQLHNLVTGDLEEAPITPLSVTPNPGARGDEISITLTIASRLNVFVDKDSANMLSTNSVYSGFLQPDTYTVATSKYQNVYYVYAKAHTYQANVIEVRLEL